MSFINGKSATFIKSFVNIVMLNILWIIFSIPIITIGISTAAMTSTVKRWHIDGEDSVIRLYFKEFKKYTGQGLMIGTPWILLGGLLVYDLWYFFNIESGLRVMLISITLIVFIFYILISAFLFPVLVHSNVQGMGIIKQSIIYVISGKKDAFAIILIWVAGIIGIYFFPVLLFFMAVPVTMITFRFSLKTMDRP